ncbi:hypothetical protein ACFQLX_07680 [Streptomyces polyrhachis]|uniref:Uncharacterized protein n=1 Tax=Streptomyces polyrhachis TaxID=1282885 RepID=A0ABW2GBT3_9ACTN
MSPRLDEEAPRRARGAPPRGGRRRREPRMHERLPLIAAAVALVAALAAAGWFVPSVREVLAQSFTRQPEPYTELYFTKDPHFDGTTVVVPLAVNDHGTGVRTHRVTVTLETAKGRAVGSTTLRVKPHRGAPVGATARLDTKGKAEAAMVRVALAGFAQTLQYSLGAATR